MAPHDPSGASEQKKWNSVLLQIIFDTTTQNENETPSNYRALSVWGEIHGVECQGLKGRSDQRDTK